MHIQCLHIDFCFYSKQHPSYTPHCGFELFVYNKKMCKMSVNLAYTKTLRDNRRRKKQFEFCANECKWLHGISVKMLVFNFMQCRKISNGSKCNSSTAWVIFCAFNCWKSIGYVFILKNESHSLGYLTHNDSSWKNITEFKKKSQHTHTNTRKLRILQRACFIGTLMPKPKWNVPCK